MARVVKFRVKAALSGDKDREIRRRRWFFADHHDSPSPWRTYRRSCCATDGNDCRTMSRETSCDFVRWENTIDIHFGTRLRTIVNARNACHLFPLIFDCPTSLLRKGFGVKITNRRWLYNGIISGGWNDPNRTELVIEYCFFAISDGTFYRVWGFSQKKNFFTEQKFI